jgi:hypothetical protein
MTTLAVMRSGHETYPAGALLAYLDERPARDDYLPAQRRGSRLSEKGKKAVRYMRESGHATPWAIDQILCELGDVHLFGRFVGESS